MLPNDGEGGAPDILLRLPCRRAYAALDGWSTETLIAQRRGASILAVAEYSDLSGNLIAGDRAAELEILFPDGRRRHLKVDADEANSLAVKGCDVARRWEVAARALVKIGRRVAKWVLLSLVAALALQAITKQWSDRQKELELKSGLASDVGSSAFAVFAEARTIAYLTPEKRTPERKLLLLSSWIRDEGRIDGVFRAYFLPEGEHQVTTSWIVFRDRLYDYLRLSCCESDAERVIRRVREYVLGPTLREGHPILDQSEWQALSCGPGCNGYADAYDQLGRRVLRGAPSRDIATANPNGFSSGFHDFVRDVVPGY